mmetsp:Transcript_29860/g.86956  ORF Transcript_29860/g.86956 Transcript_29860/m.86956 type:complete len:260 (+) Transcript_29860:973-1752(+)
MKNTVSTAAPVGWMLELVCPGSSSGQVSKVREGYPHLEVSELGVLLVSSVLHQDLPLCHGYIHELAMHGLSEFIEEFWRCWVYAAFVKAEDLDEGGIARQGSCVADKKLEGLGGASKDRVVLPQQYINVIAHDRLHAVGRRLSSGSGGGVVSDDKAYTRFQQHWRQQVCKNLWVGLVEVDFLSSGDSRSHGCNGEFSGGWFSRGQWQGLEKSASKLVPGGVVGFFARKTNSELEGHAAALPYDGLQMGLGLEGSLDAIG